MSNIKKLYKETPHSNLSSSTRAILAKKHEIASSQLTYYTILFQQTRTMLVHNVASSQFSHFRVVLPMGLTDLHH